MADITVKNSAGVELYKITTDTTTNQVTKVEAKSGALIDASTLQDMLKGVELTGTGWDLDKIMNSVAEGGSAAKLRSENASDLGTRLNGLMAAIEELKQKVEAETDPAKKSQLQTALSLAKVDAQKIIADLKGRANLPPDAQAALNTAQANTPSPAPTGAAKAQVTTGGAQPQAQASAPQPAAQQQGAAQQGTFPGGGKASGLPAQGKPFDVQAMLQSSMMQSANMGSLDQLGKNQMDQKKMMMLFMYFAMMAMSGDVGAMTAFMQFITTIITKDKAQLNIQMANKLIELEDANRKAVDQLMNTPSYDPNNAQVGADFTKVMEKVKADEGSIATSQKLIAQMMEDFSQVSEFLNNLQKSMLDVRGRLLSRLSTFSA